MFVLLPRSPPSFGVGRGHGEAEVLMRSRCETIYPSKTLRNYFPSSSSPEFLHQRMCLGETVSERAENGRGGAEKQ